MQVGRIGWGLAAVAVVAFGALAASLGSTAAEAGRWLGHGHRHGFHHGEIDPEDVRDGVSWMLRGVDASDEQVDRITEIAVAALADLRESRPRREAMHDAVTGALSGESVDREALEATRAEMLASVAALSERITLAVADAAEVLTPEQRAELAARHAERRERRGWRH